MLYYVQVRKERMMNAVTTTTVEKKYLVTDGVRSVLWDECPDEREQELCSLTVVPARVVCYADGSMEVNGDAATIDPEGWLIWL